MAVGGRGRNRREKGEKRYPVNLEIKSRMDKVPVKRRRGKKERKKPAA